MLSHKGVVVLAGMLCACEGAADFYRDGLDPAQTAALAGVALVGSGLRIIPQGQGAIVERLGRFHRTLGAGLSYVVPMVDRIAYRESMRERILDIPPQPCITSDNAPLRADAVVFYRIVDLQRLVYSVDDVRASVANIVLTQIRSEIGKLTLDQTFSNREALNQILLRGINEVAAGWGVLITRIEVKDITPSREIQSSMELQLAAERKKRAAILESEGDRQAVVNRAEGQKQATVMRAEGERKSAELRGEGLGRSLEIIQNVLGKTKEASRLDATQIILLKDFISAQLSLAGSSNAKVVVLPSSLQGALQGLMK